MDSFASVQTGTGTSKYVGDADGNLLTRTAPSGNTTLYLPGQEITIAPGNTAVTVNRYYSLAGMTIATRVNANNVIFLMSDLHGSNEVAVDPLTWAVTRRYLDPFGNALGTVTGGTWPGDHGFIGKSVNATTALVDVGAREYDPTTGRFTSVDPVLTPDDPRAANGYTYADNNPLTNTDPLGLHPVDANGDWVGCNLGRSCQINSQTQPSATSTTTPSGWHAPMLLPAQSGSGGPRSGSRWSPNRWDPSSALPWSGSPGTAGTNMAALILGSSRAWDLGGRHASDDLLRAAASLRASQLLFGGSLLLGAAGSAMTFRDDIVDNKMPWQYAAIDAGSQGAGGYLGATAGSAAFSWGATAVGAELGADAGSVVPVAGTLAGAAVGAIVGTVIGSGLGHAAIDWISSW